MSTKQLLKNDPSIKKHSLSTLHRDFFRARSINRNGFSLAEISEYLTLNGLPWLLLAWASIYIFRPFATIIHELGHAISAVIFTSQTVQIKVGVGQGSLNFSIKSLKLEISFKKMIFGYTAFQNANLANIQLALIYATGPIFSFLACTVGLWLIYTTKLHTALDALW